MPAATFLLVATALARTRDLELAIAVLRQAQELRPDDFWLNHMLAIYLMNREPPDWEAAIRHFAIAAALRPQSAGVHSNLGLAYGGSGDLEAAVRSYKRAIDLKPTFSYPYHNLGTLYQSFGRLEDAETAFRLATKHHPQFASAQAHLGYVLLQGGKFDEGLAELRRAEALAAADPRGSPVASRWLRDWMRIVGRERHLPRFLEQPDTPADALALAEAATLCFVKGRDADALALFDRAFVQGVAWADFEQQQHRFNAICAAARLGTGQNLSRTQLAEAEPVRRRQQALEWLRAELKDWTAAFERDPRKTARELSRTLQVWQRHIWLAGLRDPSMLARLPREEQQACRQFWNDVGLLFLRARTA